MRRILPSVALVSMAAIAYEILLMRMLSIVQWHHFAWMVISLALLGYGASGTAIALAGNRLAPRFENGFALSALLFSVTMVGCWIVAQYVPFNALEVIWDVRQLLWLGVLYLLFMLPFFFAAVCIGMAFSFCSDQPGRIYFVDLLGAGAGAVLVIVLLFVMAPPAALVLLSALALAASLRAGRGTGLRTAAFAWALLLVILHSSGLTGLRVSEFKGLSQALQTVGSRVLHESSSPLGMLTVVENRQVPFRHAPGLSIATRHIPPDQLAVFRDADGMSAISRWNGPAPPPWLGDTTSALPYQLTDAPDVLILGAGTGTDTMQALLHGAARVDAVELDPAMAGLVRGRFAGFSGSVFDHPGVRLHIGEARGFSARSRARYDLVQIGLLDSFAVSGSGVQALNENYLYTKEAFLDYLALLKPNGILSITRWLKVPPRDSLKLVNTLASALRDAGVADPAARIAMIRDWSTTTLVLKNGELGIEDISKIEAFTDSRAFDAVHYPGIKANRSNRFYQLERPWFHEGVQALLGPDAETFQDRYKFDIEVATDERPYFFNFFRWPVFLEAMALRDRGGAALVEWGYLVPAATLVQAALAGSVLILLPLLLAGKAQPVDAGKRTGAYFFLLGLAFLFIEIAFIQKFTLFLSYPLYAVVVVLAGFLVFAGIGSILSVKLARRAGQAGISPVRVAVTAIVMVTLAYLWLLPIVFDRWLACGDAARIAIALLLIAPLAVFMGMPFPLGLAQLAKTTPRFIPWAWGINGFASVISAALATLLAIEFGFTAVLLLALLLYLAAAWLTPDRGLTSP